MSASAKNERLQQLASLGPVVARLKEIAEQSQDALLTEGTPHPDHKLLDLCAEALYHRKRYAALREQYHALPLPYGNPPATAEQNRLRDEINAESCVAGARAAHLTKAAAKIRATTPAGIYAKALVVRSSQTGAAVLAMSLAQELIECPGLRASLWPAEMAVETPV